MIDLVRFVDKKAKEEKGLYTLALTHEKAQISAKYHICNYSSTS